jgi:DNA-binding transcriptional regulator YiaG
MSSTQRASPAPYPPNAALRTLLSGGRWTVSKLSQRLGVSSRTLQRWNAGDSRPLQVFEREMLSLLNEDT